MTYTRRRCERGGRLTVDLSSDHDLFLEPQTVVARSNGGVVGRVRACAGTPRRAERPGRARLPARRDCRVVYTVSPTAIPAKVTAGGNPDPRASVRTSTASSYRPAR